MKRSDLITRLGELAVDLGAVAAPAGYTSELTAVCATARLAFGAAAVSVASLAGSVLTYRAASGEGADIIVGTELPVSRGIAGYVAVTGQAMVIDHPIDDPRFARAVAQRTGYVPESLLVVPIDAPDGGVAGVLSVLDRSIATAEALTLASAFAVNAGSRLAAVDAASSAGRVILASVIAAAGSDDPDLAAALRRATRALPDADHQLAEVATVLAGLRRLDDATRAAAVTIISDVLDLATGRRRAR
jgi:hypothetical protein